LSIGTTLTSTNATVVGGFVLAALDIAISKIESRSIVFFI